MEVTDYHTTASSAFVTGRTVGSGPAGAKTYGLGQNGAGSGYGRIAVGEIFMS